MEKLEGALSLFDYLKVSECPKILNISNGIDGACYFKDSKHKEVDCETCWLKAIEALEEK